MNMPGYSIFISEFIGTAILLLLGCGVSANVSLRTAYGHAGGWLLVSIGWGFGVFAGASIAWHSGGQLNPAVTLGLALHGSIPWSTVPWYVAAQLTGAMTGALLAYLSYKKQFDTQKDRERLGRIFFTAPSVRSSWWNITTEAIATFVLVYFVLQSSPFQPGTGDSTPVFGNSALGYAAVSFVVIGIGASLGGPTGYSINPTRDLGPRITYSLLRIANKGPAEWGYAWIPIIGPLLGGAAAAGVFALAGTY
ncbi:MAG: MIP/aquaporin family protein [Candidatus Nanopelagicales bacterium]|nr:MIP/aquaporin family protein [Candidatus Nanopelagicales bacterium]